MTEVLNSDQELHMLTVWGNLSLYTDKMTEVSEAQANFSRC